MSNSLNLVSKSIAALKALLHRPVDAAAMELLARSFAFDFHNYKDHNPLDTGWPLQMNKCIRRD